MWDSNPRHLDPQPNVLPTELMPQRRGRDSNSQSREGQLLSGQTLLPTKVPRHIYKLG